MSNSFYHKDLTEAQWSRIKFVFEAPKRVGRPSLNPRRVFNAILWILKSGARWRDLPARYGNWNSIYHKFRLWCSQGLFEHLLKIINSDAKDATLLELDSTFCKVHQSACSALKDQTIGASRGGIRTPRFTSSSTREYSAVKKFLLKIVFNPNTDKKIVSALFERVRQFFYV